jgi:MFS family permease
MGEAEIETSQTDAVPNVAIWSTFRETPAAVKAILCGVLLNRLSGSLNIFLVLYLTARGYSSGQAVFSLAAYGAGGIAGSIVGGTLADRLGPRAVIVLSMAGTGAFTAALLFLPGYVPILGSVTLAGLCAQMFRPASSTLLSEFTAENRQVMIFAIYRFCINLGVMAAPLIGYALFDLDHQSYTVLFWVQAVIAAGFAVSAWLLLTAGKAEGAGKRASARPVSGGYLALRHDRRYMLFLVATLIYSAVYVQYLSTLPLMVHAAGLKIYWYTLAVSLNAFIVIAFELLMTKVTQHWPKQVALGLGMVLLGAGMAVYGLAAVPLVILGGTALWSFGEVVSGPTFFSYPVVVAGGRPKGRYIGGFQFSVGVGTAIGPVTGGWLYLRLGQGAWPVLAAGSLIAAFCVVEAVRPARAEGLSLRRGLRQKTGHSR